MGRGNSGRSSRTAAQKATKAVAIENMNEAQLDKEIAATQRTIASLDKVMKSNSLDDSESRAMRGAFPLGVGMRTEAQKKKQAAVNERDAKKAAKFTEALEKKKAAESRLKEKQIKTEAVKKAVKETPTSLKWKTTQKGGWVNGGYAPKIIKAGNIEIHGSGGFYTIFKDGKQIGRTDKLNKAKAAAEKLSKR